MDEFISMYFWKLLLHRLTSITTFQCLFVLCLYKSPISTHPKAHPSILARSLFPIFPLLSFLSDLITFINSLMSKQINVHPTFREIFISSYAFSELFAFKCQLVMCFSATKLNQNSFCAFPLWFLRSTETIKTFFSADQFGR